ncbi:MAG TPA: PepSY domain-containing protein [Candidatus Limivivens merdigallinarum]|uniref:PepSY domain-containing protein n=1 Tax=Candidatus Limivivens merdigallinarum TaxID=2840859 RepID=A0A9D0ZXI2_9FIRM|nr:PepSY domain-containing protein [Candidatus Limivivens merdigallinarum]
MKNNKLLLSITAAALAASLLGAGASATAIPKTQKIQETEAKESSSAVSAEKTEASTEALPGKGDSIAIDQPEDLSPISSAEEAESLALEYAELTSEDVTQLRSEMDQDDGRTEYEVEFNYGNLECSYELNGETGEVLKFSYEVIDKSLLSDLPDGPITLEEASELALSQVDNAAESDIRLEEDQDDGRTVYEGKIIFDNVQYEFEIDAASGEITDWSAESVFS